MVDDTRDVTDVLLYVNGTDTVVSGTSYHKVFSRSSLQSVPLSAGMPPVTNVVATISDIYYGAFRESDKKIYLLSASGEHVIYDFNASVGSTIQGYSGLVTVTAIDAITLADGDHKRYKTTDTGYSVIEGVGSTRGLMPQLISGGGLNSFMCFKHDPVTYIAPMSTGVPCTNVAPLPSEDAVTNVNGKMAVSIYPVPASNTIHLASGTNTHAKAVITNCIGQSVWQDALSGNMDINVNQWPRGIYFIKVADGQSSFSQKIILQ